MPLFRSADLCRQRGLASLIVAQPVFRELLEKAASVDLSVLSVGDATAKSLQVKYGLPAGADIRELAASGAVGDLLGRYIDEEGQPVRHPLNGQVISPDLEDYRKVETRIIASGGTHKRRVIAASLRGKLATALVTDADTARWLLSRGR